jgi:glycosyltransferase involved in cell wall biosynthesis
MYRVSVIMPCSRPEDLEHAIGMYLKQDYENKELLICMDSEGYTLNSDPSNSIYQWGYKGLTVGAKRNNLCSFGKGEIIVHMDSDDSYAPNWITHSVNQLLNTKADLTGLDTGIFKELSTGKRWQYIYKTGQVFILGATMAYWRKTWQRAPFPNKISGEDAEFCATAGIVLPHGYVSGFEASIHPKNTCKRYTHDKRAWKYLGQVTNP